ncbi:hypothetical protein LTR37_009707 [Vermiconidia calcicola]|uniref:Uncharacterized protein n=1 Tax=Vermiconidia calcicola TaxID=1690605 RepID=A0ACC3N7P5_9PEZI|nr:hypothetical protein LTR37_009707 [Vermiconidia calcicola]
MANTYNPKEYILPTDEPEAYRLNYQHKLLCDISGGLYRAPLDESKALRVLDIGCGTTNWAIEFAEQYPNASVHGFDMNESNEWEAAPSNCHLWVANLESEETWPALEDAFDYVHSRFITVGVKDWPTFLARCLDNVTPGDWIELQELICPATCEVNVSASESSFLR